MVGAQQAGPGGPRRRRALHLGRAIGGWRQGKGSSSGGTGTGGRGHGDEVNHEIQGETLKYSTAEVVELMDRADVPVAPVNTRQSMIDDPHVRHRGIVVETEHPTAGRIRQARPPGRFSRTPAGLRRHAPLFGEHTDEILAEVLARTPAEITALRDEGAVR